MDILPLEFYLQDTPVVARGLLGKFLVHETKKGLVKGKIVETEAYLSEDDPGCHAAKGMTKRNASMFKQGGVAYVYLIYGMYYCFNVVTGREGKGEAVLIRALTPLQGGHLMVENRGGRQKIYSLCSGPGKLCQAFDIGIACNELDLRQKPLYILEGQGTRDVTVTQRVGLSQGADKLLRYYITGCSFVSRR